jgi:hypothetical protein
VLPENGGWDAQLGMKFFPPYRLARSICFVDFDFVLRWLQATVNETGIGAEMSGMKRPLVCGRLEGVLKDVVM